MAILAAAPPPLPGTGSSAAFLQDPSGSAEIVSVAPKRRTAPRPGKRAARPPAASVEAANRAALQVPRSDGFVDSVQVYPWTEGGIYQLYTAPGHITDIALEPGEALTAVAAGDTVRWIVGDTTSGSGASRQVHILLKPTAAGLSTNLVITTDRRIYRLQAEATQRTAMAAVSWTYPGDTLLALSVDPAGSATAPLQFNRDAAPFDFRYVLKGDKPSWRPLRVFNDGRQVFIEFSKGLARDQAPPLFARSRDGTTELVNYRVQGRYYIVDRLFEAAELRLGGKKQKVVRIEHRSETDR
jgi:type IV secretion system protein VirB9